MIESLMIDSRGDEWFIVWPDGDKYAGPYKRAQDAKGQLTRLLQGYTPAARKIND
jgi:hypothetical protein